MLMRKGEAPMTAQQRRDAIRDVLTQAAGPVSATALAGRFGVSRQLIVGDIALLRAGGAAIEATARGYVVQIVEHPVYGQLTGSLGLASRYDIQQFIRRAQAARPLSLLTEGVHLHTLSCPDQEAFLRIRGELAGAGFLLE